jgi:hypothetical protein
VTPPRARKSIPLAQHNPVKSPFTMPNAVKITGRTSSITNSFINALIPVVKPTTDEVMEALEILHMSPDTICCAYCGGPYSEWDHLRPLVKEKQPTGHISEIHNLVPACQKCNQSKGNKEWRSWMFGTAKQSPATRGIADIHERADRLTAYEAWQLPTVVDFRTLVGDETWDAHWAHHEAIIESMRTAQTLAEQMRITVAASYLALTRPESHDPTDVDPVVLAPSQGRATFVVSTIDGDTPPLSKRDAVLALVTALAATGVPCESLSIVIGRTALRPVEEVAGRELLWEAFADEHGQRADQRKLWFVDEAIHQDGRTWLLANNRWGRDSERTMTDLVKLGPDFISYRRSGDTRTISEGVQTEWS